MNKVQKIFLLIFTFSVVIFFKTITIDGIVEKYNDGFWGIELIGYRERAIENEIRIAILDTGIYQAHSAFENLEFSTYDLTYIMGTQRDLSHGTAIMGIIASLSPVSVIQIPDNLKVYDIRVLNNYGRGIVEDLILGIQIAINYEVHIINISSGFNMPHPELENTILEALNQGIVVISAAGNTYGLSVDLPARIENVISVNAINYYESRSIFGARGSINLIAPGENVYSLCVTNQYDYFTGTSFSAAYVTGALITHLDYFLNQYEEVFSIDYFLNWIFNRADLLENQTTHSEYGYGILRTLK